MTLVRRLPWVVSATETDWDALYAEYLPRIYNFFRYRVGDGAEAEDLTSLTFQKSQKFVRLLICLCRLVELFPLLATGYLQLCYLYLKYALNR